METILPPLDLSLHNDLWKPQPSSHPFNSLTALSQFVHLHSLFTAKGSSASTCMTNSAKCSFRPMGMSDVLRSQALPIKENSLVRLPSIGVMINRDASPKSFSPVYKHCTEYNKQHLDTKTTSPRQPELVFTDLLADVAVKWVAKQRNRKILPALIPSTVNNKARRTSNAKLCGMSECNKRAKAGGFCIAHGGGLRCSKVGCAKHAVSLGLCISHGGGKRCTVKGCLNASRKNGVCWSHGGKRLCKFEGCKKGPKSGGYCWSHGGKMKK